MHCFDAPSSDAQPCALIQGTMATYVLGMQASDGLLPRGTLLAALQVGLLHRTLPWHMELVGARSLHVLLYLRV